MVGPGPLAGHGLRFIPVEHAGNSNASARCVAAIVANPALLTPDCRIPEQMRLANPFCRFLEFATPAPVPAWRS